MSLIPIKLTIIASQGGARGDFLAGWLGTLPEYMENYWTLDCETGQSFTNAKFLKDFQPESMGSDIETFLAGYKLVLDTDSKINVSGTSHRADILDFFPENKKSCIKLVFIRVPKSKIIEISWNFFVKTFFTKHRNYGNLDHVVYGIDHLLGDQPPITDQKRLCYIKNFLSHLHYPKTFDPPAAGIVLDYEEIFRPGGSRVVAENLSLTCSENHHRLWDKNLEFSSSPLEIERFGQIFKFQDFQDIYQNQNSRHP